MLKFTRLQEKHLEIVLSWRIKPEINRFMLTDVENDIEKQKIWFKNISKDQRCKYWIISYNNTVIGLINLLDIDHINKRCNIGYYIGEETYKVFAGMILPYIYNYVFYEMGFNKIYGEVIENNKAIMKIHMLHGYREVGTYENHLFRDGQFQDVIIVELMKERWDSLQKKYKNCRIEFES
jgi:UDP-4-amino-4,6-dideoxy-N-acetyl-beta-L-altrosamine N-acetyltransferase